MKVFVTKKEYEKLNSENNESKFNEESKYSQTIFHISERQN